MGRAAVSATGPAASFHSGSNRSLAQESGASNSPRRARLPLGYTCREQTHPVGFAYPGKTTDQASANKIEALDAEAGVITIAPTGSGKTTGCVLPNALTYKGPLTCIDPKGEVAAVAAAQRRSKEMGNQHVAIIDPFGQTANWNEQQPDRINPLELISAADEADAADIARDFANVMCHASTHRNDPFWAQAAQAYLTSILLFVARLAPLSERTLKTVADIAFAEGEAMAVILAAMMRTQNIYAGTISHGASMVANAPDRTRESILTTLRTALAWLGSPRVQTAFSKPTIPISALREGALDGRTLSIFFVIPLEKMDSFQPLLQLWSNTLCRAMFQRKNLPHRPTLAIFEEAAALGELTALKSCFTQMRGFGVIPHLVYQDLSQLQEAFPETWKLLFANADAIQVFGARHAKAADDIAAAIGFGGDLLDLNHREQVVSLPFKRPQRMQRLDVTQDAWLAKRANVNPFYTRTDSAETAA